MGKKFNGRLNFSEIARRETAFCLNKKGFTVLLPAQVEDENNRLENGSYDDGGDLFYLCTDEMKWKKVESKRRKNIDHFTNASDFPYSTMIVTELRRDYEKPDVYIIWNPSLTHFFEISRKSREKWEVVEKYDRHYKRRIKYLVADLCLGKFVAAAEIKRNDRKAEGN